MDRGAETLRILIADDHPIFRRGLRNLLETESSFAVVGEAQNAEETITLARRLNPDVLLLDVAMPDQSGLDVLRALGSNSSPLRTVILTAAIETPQIVAALKLGARGVVLKGAATQILFECIRTVMADQYWVGRKTIGDLVQALIRQAPSAKEEERQRFGLTSRELEIISAIVAGCTNKDVAKTLRIAENTVKHHLANIFNKLGVSNRLELVLFAANHHLIDED
jgi:two-component system, NarL family, nitrate/nitrite response regulator NarL